MPKKGNFTNPYQITVKMWQNHEFWWEISKMRVVILNPGPRPKFERNFCGFPGSDGMNAPFFLKRQYIEGLQKINLFFPWRSPMMTYFPPNECKYPNYSLFCEMGGFCKKGRTPGERWPKCLQLTQLFWKNCLGSISLLVEKKFSFQNSKFPKITLIWRYSSWRTSPRQNMSEGNPPEPTGLWGRVKWTLPHEMLWKKKLKGGPPIWKGFRGEEIQETNFRAVAFFCFQKRTCLKCTSQSTRSQKLIRAHFCFGATMPDMLHKIPLKWSSRFEREKIINHKGFTQTQRVKFWQSNQMMQKKKTTQTSFCCPPTISSKKMKVFWGQPTNWSTKNLNFLLSPKKKKQTNRNDDHWLIFPNFWKSQNIVHF